MYLTSQGLLGISLTVLSLSFSIYRMGLIKVPASQGSREGEMGWYRERALKASGRRAPSSQSSQPIPYLRSFLFANTHNLQMDARARVPGHLETCEKFEWPQVHIPAQVEQGHALPSRFTSHSAECHPVPPSAGRLGCALRRDGVCDMSVLQARVPELLAMSFGVNESTVYRKRGVSRQKEQ